MRTNASLPISGSIWTLIFLYKVSSAVLINLLNFGGSELISLATINEKRAAH